MNYLHQGNQETATGWHSSQRTLRKAVRNMFLVRLSAYTLISASIA